MQLHIRHCLLSVTSSDSMPKTKLRNVLEALWACKYTSLTRQPCYNYFQEFLSSVPSTVTSIYSRALGEGLNSGVPQRVTSAVTPLSLALPSRSIVCELCEMMALYPSCADVATLPLVSTIHRLASVSIRTPGGALYALHGINICFLKPLNQPNSLAVDLCLL